MKTALLLTLFISAIKLTHIQLCVSVWTGALLNIPSASEAVMISCLFPQNPTPPTRPLRSDEHGRYAALGWALIVNISLISSLFDFCIHSSPSASKTCYFGELQKHLIG